MTVTTGLQPQQQLEAYAQATADATGAAQFKFPFVPQSLAWVGNVTITGAPYSSLLVANVGTTPWGVWTGPLPFGPIMAPQRTQLIITATGLQPGITYSAVWLGISDLADSIGPIMPAPASAVAATFPVAPILSVFNQGGTSFTSPQFQCSNVAGARYVIQNNDAVNAIVVQLRYRPTAGPITTAPVNAQGAPQLPVFSTGSTFRNIIVPAAGFANFTHPHLADYLTITVTNPPGSAVNFNMVVTHVASNKIVWSGIIHEFVPDALLAFSGNTAVGANVGIASSVDVYAGPAFFSLAPGLATPFTANLFAMDTAGTFELIAHMDQNSLTTSGGSLMVIVPPAPLRLDFTNGSAAIHPIQLALIADSWRD